MSQDETQTTETTETKTETIETEEIKEEEKEVEEEKEEVEESKDEDKEELEQAKQLFKALKNPQSARLIAQSLAEQFGLIETKKEAKEAKTTILDTFKKSLGEEYSFLAEKIAPAVEFAVNERLETVKQILAQQEQKQTEREVEDALSHLTRATKGESKKYENRITELMDEVLPSPKISTRDYLFKLYKLASEEGKERETKKAMAEKINKNAADIGSRLRTSGLDDSRAGKVQKPTLKQSIEMAMKELK